MRIFLLKFLMLCRGLRLAFYYMASGGSKEEVLNLKSVSNSESGVHHQTQEFYNNGLRIQKRIHVH